MSLEKFSPQQNSVAPESILLVERVLNLSEIEIAELSIGNLEECIRLLQQEKKQITEDPFGRTVFHPVYDQLMKSLHEKRKSMTVDNL